MTWTNCSDVITLAKEGCTICKGYGFRTIEPCNCVLRAIFRACLARFTNCVHSRGQSGARLEFVSKAVNSPRVFGRKNEEFMADFIGIAKRTLTDLEYDIFRFYFLLAADWKMCGRRLGITDKGSFFHIVYRVEQKLGRAFRETEPYGIYPLDAYFAATSKDERVTPCVLPPADRFVPVRPPLMARAA